MTRSRLLITGTTHTLPFDKLSPRDFERLCLWLIEREGYERAEHLGAAGSEQGRDIVAWHEGAQWAFQCKRVRHFGPKDALAAVEKVLALPENQRPVGLVFLVTCDVSASTRKKARARCAGEMECDFWAGTELDEKVKRHQDILEQFFQAAKRGEIEKTPTERLAEIWAKIRVDSLSKLLVILFGVLLLFTGIQAWVFLPPMPPTRVQTDPTGVSCAVKYPRWIAVGDVEEVTITLINNSNKVLTEVNAFLVFTNTLHVSTDVNSGNKVNFGELAANEQKTGSIRFLLDRADTKSPLKAELRIAANELGEKTLDTYAFRVIYDRLPIPYCKTILQRLVAFVLLAVSSIGAFIGKEALKTLQACRVS